jgi:uncharacterized membrane protein
MAAAKATVGPAKMSSEEAAPEGGGLGFERLVFFSDAVFAIAITVLVLDLRPTEVVAGGVVNWPLLVSKLAGFGLSFYVIGRYWRAHHALFETVRTYDSALISVNLAFLACIAFVPFPTGIVIDAPATRGPVLLYVGSLLSLSLAMTALVLSARRPRLLKPGETSGGTVAAVLGAAGSALVFLVACGLCLADPRLALWSLLLLVPAGLVASRLGAAAEARATAAVRDDHVRS